MYKDLKLGGFGKNFALTKFVSKAVLSKINSPYAMPIFAWAINGKIGWAIRPAEMTKTKLFSKLVNCANVPSDSKEEGFQPDLLYEWGDVDNMINRENFHVDRWRGLNCYEKAELRSFLLDSEVVLNTASRKCVMNILTDSLL